MEGRQKKLIEMLAAIDPVIYLEVKDCILFLLFLLLIK